MSTEAQRLLVSFEALPEADQNALAAEILRRTFEGGYSSPDEAELIASADEVFLELDRREDGLE